MHIPGSFISYALPTEIFKFRLLSLKLLLSLKKTFQYFEWWSSMEHAISESHPDGGKKLHTLICPVKCLCLLATMHSTHIMRTVHIKKKKTPFCSINITIDIIFFPNPSNLCTQMSICAGMNSVLIAMWRSWFNWFKWKGSKELFCSLAI